MREHYTVTHTPSGRSVVVLAYTPEEAQKKALVQLQKLVGVASTGTKPPATSPQPPAHANNTTVTDHTGAAVTSKLQTAPQPKKK